MIELQGISWNHRRGHDPMVATAAAFAERRPGVHITWQTRSLQDFADFSIERLAETFDLLLIDHPFIGFGSASGCLLPVDQHVDATFLAEQADNSVGRSHESYLYGGHLWALATDAASHVSAYRPDLLTRIGVDAPRTWDDVLTLAQRQRGASSGQVGIPLIPVDALMSFCSICANAGEEPFTTEDVVVSRPAGRHALELLRALNEASHPSSPSLNPPKLLDLMATTDEIAYSPLLFGYSNYAQPGFRPNLVRFTDVPAGADGVPRGAILGGVGLAVSSSTPHARAAFDYAAFVASPEIQRTLYFAAGGQPARRSAWLDAAVNAASSNFFSDTLETLDHSYLRPCYNGYLPVQEQAGELLHSFLQEDETIDGTLETLDKLYRGSRAI